MTNQTLKTHWEKLVENFEQVISALAKVRVNDFTPFLPSSSLQLLAPTLSFIYYVHGTGFCAVIAEVKVRLGLHGNNIRKGLYIAHSLSSKPSHAEYAKRRNKNVFTIYKRMKSSFSKTDFPNAAVCTGLSTITSPPTIPKIPLRSVSIKKSKIVQPSAAVVSVFRYLKNWIFLLSAIIVYSTSLIIIPVITSSPYYKHTCFYLKS